MSHLRTRDGVEVDLLVAFDDGSVVGIGVTAASRVGPADIRGLRYLRDRLGDRFIQGVLLCTVERPPPLHDRITALPFEALWTM